jgi:hypothetical protein
MTSIRNHPADLAESAGSQKYFLRTAAISAGKLYFFKIMPCKIAFCITGI